VENLYERNGLVFWSEDEIRVRDMFVSLLVADVTSCLKTQNRAFEVFRCEAPVLTPSSLVNPNYARDQMFVIDDLTLRPETTMGSFAYARHLLNPHHERKARLPLAVWQHGKSFRREQDQPTKFMRLKEFHQLELQVLYGPTTATDYSIAVIAQVHRTLSRLLGPCRVEPSDRLPDYAEWTKDVIHEAADMEICSISRRKDFESACVLEVAVGTDRCVSCFSLTPP
jgi:glycyl-tRNA synthetase